jgi:DNA sulfur modification protein DndB
MKEFSMSVTVPVITARMGSRDYYITKMTAFELAGQVGIASELTDWKELTLEELYQRDLNRKRVEQEIAPYLANARDRFFGSIIVWILGDDVVTFETVGDFVSVSAAYARAAKSLGFLIIDNSQRRSGLVALDGQHRLAALREVVQGNTDGEFRGEVANDEIAVIFVRDTEVRSARDLFTVLNRSARKVSKNDVLIMGEVDGAAIVARRLASHRLLAPNGLNDHPLVKWDSNTIARKDTQFTTLNAIYEVVKKVATYLKIDLLSGEDSGNPPPESETAAVFDASLFWLSTLFEESDDFAAMRIDPAAIAEGRGKEAPFSLLLKPVGFQSFFGAVATLLERAAGEWTPRDAVRSLLQVDWSLSSPSWSGIMVNTRGNVTNRAADVSLASDLAAWLAGGKVLDASFQEALRERLRKQTNIADLDLPQPLGAN